MTVILEQSFNTSLVSDSQQLGYATKFSYRFHFTLSFPSNSGWKVHLWHKMSLSMMIAGI
jgi:hypothetical protein